METKYVVTIVDTETGEMEVLKGEGVICNVYESEEKMGIAIKRMNVDLAKRLFEATIGYMEEQIAKMKEESSAEQIVETVVNEDNEGGI
jgi:hypothetical protein